MSIPNSNLINFEHPTSKDSSYVLTSPKSLKACQKAGVKPVELLYKSLSDVKKTVGKRQAAQVYEQLETERQRKLDTCRKIRNELLMQGYPYYTSSPKGELNKETSTGIFLPEPHLSQDNLINNITSADLWGPNNNRSLVSPSVQIIVKGSPVKSCSSVKSFTTSEFKEATFPLVNKPETVHLKTSEDHDTAFQKDTPFTLPAVKPEGSVNCEERVVRTPVDEIFPPKPIKRGGKKRKSFRRSHSLPLRSETETKVESKPGSRRSSTTPILEKKTNQEKQDFSNNLKTPLVNPFYCRKKITSEGKKLLECQRMCEKIRLQYKEPDYCLLKYRQIIENGVERELREQEVKKVQRKIEEGFEMWQDKILMLQWLDSERAEEQALNHLSSKIEKMRMKQRNKEIVHTINMNKVKEESDIKADILRREWIKKERKIQILQEEKERVMVESKSRALAVKELKEQIRNIMTPETFDQKVIKCGREKKPVRILHPPNRCPTIMQRSHISLG